MHQTCILRSNISSFTPAFLSSRTLITLLLNTSMTSTRVRSIPRRNRINSTTITILQNQQFRQLDTNRRTLTTQYTLITTPNMANIRHRTQRRIRANRIRLTFNRNLLRSFRPTFRIMLRHTDRHLIRNRQTARQLLANRRILRVTSNALFASTTLGQVTLRYAATSHRHRRTNTR